MCRKEAARALKSWQQSRSATQTDPAGPARHHGCGTSPNHPPPTPAQLDRAEQISRRRAPLRTVTLSGPIAAEILRESSSWRGYDSMTVWDKLPEALVHRASLNGFQTRLSNSFIELNIYYYIVCSLSLVTIVFFGYNLYNPWYRSYKVSRAAANDLSRDHPRDSAWDVPV